MLYRPSRISVGDDEMMEGLFQSLSGSVSQITQTTPNNLLSRAPPYFRRHVKPLVQAAFAVISTHQPALGPRGGLWSVLLMYVIHKEGLCPSRGNINRLMMMMTPKCKHFLLYLQKFEKFELSHFHSQRAIKSLYPYRQSTCLYLHTTHA
jgi:hypothetical protein